MVVAMLVLLVVAGVVASVVVLRADRRGAAPLEVGARRLSRGSQRVGIVVCAVVVAAMAVLTLAWTADDIVEAPLALAGTSIAAGALVLMAVRPTALRASLALTLALIPPAFLLWAASGAIECANTDCSWTRAVGSPLLVTVLVALALVLLVLELAQAVVRLSRRGARRD